MTGQIAGNGTFTRACRPINSNHDLCRQPRGRGTCVQAHPRFFVPCLGRAAKPKRLLALALGLATVATAVVRLEVLRLRTGRASEREAGRLPGRAAGRTADRSAGLVSLRDALPARATALDLGAGFAPFAWPLCCPQAGAALLAGRTAGREAVGRKDFAPATGRLLVPLERAPFEEAVWDVKR